MQKIFYIHVPLAIVSLCGFVLGGVFAIGYLRTGDRRWDMRSYVRDPHVADLRGRRADHRLDLGQGVVGPLVGVERADAGLLPDRDPAVRTYQPLRFSIEDPERQARYASVFAIVAGAFVPLNFIAVRLARSTCTRAC